MLDEDH